MIHLHDTSLNLTAVMGSLRFPVLAVGAPYGQAVAPAREDIASVEGLEAKFRCERDEARVEGHSVQRAGVASKH